MSIKDAIQYLKDEMRSEGISSEQGLGTELFLFSSTLAPVINVDLLIFNHQDRVLLSWRNDRYDKAGWHVPGRCIRFQETIEDSIQRCAITEIGTRVSFDPEPIKVYEFHWNTYRSELEDQKERAHFVTLVFSCKVPENYRINNSDHPKGTPGYLQWFKTIPVDIVPIQACYKTDWELLKARINPNKGEFDYVKVEK